MKGVALAAIVLLASLVVPLPSADAQDACPSIAYTDGVATVVDLQIAGHCRLLHRTLRVTGNVSISGTLTLVRSTLTFEGAGHDQLLSVAAGGLLDLVGSTVDRSASAAYKLLLAGRVVGDLAHAGPFAAACYHDKDADTAYDSGEVVYLRASRLDCSRGTRVGDLRLVGNESVMEGRRVDAADVDVGRPLRALERAAWDWHDADADKVFDGDEVAYLDVDGGGTVTTGDLRVAPTPALPSRLVEAQSTDVGRPLCAAVSTCSSRAHAPFRIGFESSTSQGLVYLSKTLLESGRPRPDVEDGAIRLEASVLGPMGSRVAPADADQGATQALQGPRLIRPKLVSIANVVRESEPTLLRLDVDECAAGIQVDDSRIRLQEISVAGCGQYGIAATRSQVLLIDVDLRALPLGLVVGAQSKLQMLRGDLSDVDQLGMVTSPTGRAFLNGTSHDGSTVPPPQGFVVEPGGVLAFAAHVAPTVRSPTCGATAASAAGAAVEARGPTNVVAFRGVVDGAGNAPAFNLTRFTKTGQAAPSVVASYAVTAKRFHNFASVDLGTDTPRHAPCLAVPNTADNDAPTWTAGSGPILSAPAGAFTKNGKVGLQWRAATDGPEPFKVSHYHVYQYASDRAPAIVARPTQLVATISEVPDGVFQYAVTPVDLVGNEGEPSNLVRVTSDATKPLIRPKLLGQAGPSAGWFRTSVVLNATAHDPTSALVAFNRSATGPLLPASQPVPHVSNVTYTQEGSYEVTLRAQDGAGNANSTLLQFGIDKVRPTHDVSILPASPNGQAGWYLSAPTLVVDASDDRSGVAHTTYRYGSAGSASKMNGTTAKLDKPGSHQVRVNTSDQAGNTRETLLDLKIDPVPPHVSWTVEGSGSVTGWNAAPVQLRVAAVDNESGLRRTQYAFQSGAWTEYVEAPVLVEADGETRLFARAFDEAGNEAPPVEARIRLDSTPPLAGQLLVRGSGADVVLDWAATPPTDARSGIARLVVERRSPGASQGIEVGVVTDPLRTGFRHESVPAGSYEYRLRAEDQAGNEAATPWMPVLVEGTSVRLDTSTPTTVSGVLKLRPKALDQQPGSVTRVTYLVDGKVLGVVEAPPYEYEFDTRTLKDGAHSFAMLTSYQDRSIEEVTTLIVENDQPLTAGHEILLLVLVGALALGNVGLWALRRRRVLREVDL